MSDNDKVNFFDNILLMVLNENAYEKGLVDEITKNSIKVKLGLKN